MIKQGAVRIDGVRIDDRSLMIDAGSSAVYQVGKRKFARVRLN
jgi:tyrosyl-tRNA synthetase